MEIERTLCPNLFLGGFRAVMTILSAVVTINETVIGHFPAITILYLAEAMVSTIYLTFFLATTTEGSAVQVLVLL